MGSEMCIRDREWSAKTKEADGRISKGEVVVIEEIQGVKLIVRKKEGQ